MNTDNHMTGLRAHLMSTLASLRDREQPMEPDRARAIAQVAGVLVDTAKVEVDYLRATGQDRSDFLETPPDALPAPATTTHTPQLNGISSITRHQLRG